ncbi:dynein axonemal heavy chain 1 [Malaya genurostris]|uniref:dynein axonemal heavy chain 1 n=1 Tax=Malaya genurostris TaxID=325434 RepID=UPI0026F3C8F8|nr:dynein axonemal heavy chain 1 [Malaya genurostris]
MSYPDLEWRASFQQNFSARKSLFETILSPRKSFRSSLAFKGSSESSKRCVYQFIADLKATLSEPRQLELILLQSGIFKERITRLDNQPQLTSVTPFLPLEWFDDFEYDPMSPERWLSIDNIQGFALVQIIDSDKWLWKSVTVVDYDEKRFLWTVMENGDVWEIPRIRLFFIYEDPTIFCERITTALERRSLSENYLRYSYLLQSMSVGEYFDLPEGMKKRIATRSNPEVLEAFNQIYRKFHTGLALNRCLEENSWLNLDPVHMTSDIAPLNAVKDCGKLYCFKDSFALLKRVIALCHPDVFHATQMVHLECETVRKMALFSLTSRDPITLADFKVANETQLKKIMRYLQNNWIERTTMQVHRYLLTTGRGWFDVSVDNWTIYQFMKLYRFVEQIKQRMQTALRDLVLDSTDNYIHCICDPCRLCLPVEDGFRWEENLIDSPFDSGKQPVFYVLLKMKEDGPCYSTDPDEFEPCLILLFDEAIRRSHDIHTIDPSLFGSLIFATDLYLSSVGLRDSVMMKRSDVLVLSCRKALIPLKAYAARFAEFKQLFFTNVAEHVETVKSSKSSLQVKEEISFQIRMRESLERTIPLSIVIGTFWVDVKPLREALIQKRKDITFALLAMLTERLRDKTSDIVNDYNEIIDRMCQKPASIEHIYDIRAFMETIPELLQCLEERMKTVVFEYEILDYFRCALPDPDFYQKWHAIAFPQTIVKQMNLVYEFHEVEVDTFRKQQVSDEAGFAGRVEDINVNISKFTTVYDVSKVTEVSIEVKKLWKSITELIDYGETLNKRQELFEMPPIDLSNLLELKDSFVVYKDLWTYAADYINAEESWCENPLSSVEVEVVSSTLKYYKSVLGSLLDSFEEQPQIQDVIKTFLTRLESFEPNVEAIELLQHPLLEPIHWAQFAKAAGIKVKISLTTSFVLFLEHNIRDYMEVLRKIIVEAEEHKEETDRLRAAEEEAQRIRDEYERNREQRRLNRTEI